MATYFDVLKKAYSDDDFWYLLIAKPAHALANAKGGPIVLSLDDQEKLFSALNDFSLVLAFDRYRNSRPTPLPFKIPPADNITDWDCTRVPWGQT